MKRQTLAFVALASAMSVAACGNILGLKDLEPYPSEGGTEEGGGDAQEDSPPDSPVMGDDTSTHDAHEGSTTDVREEDGAAPDGPGVDSPSEVGPDVGPDVEGDVVTMDVLQDTTPPMDSPPTCDAGEMLCGATCVNTSSNGSNCGSCGHSCQGGGCAGGKCQALQMFSAVPADIVLAGGNIFWVDGTSGVWSCPIASCTGGTEVTTGSAPTRIAFDGASSVFWTNSGSSPSIGQYDFTSHTVSTLTVNGVTLSAPQGIVADTNWVLWTDPPLYQVVRCPHAGGTCTAAGTSNGYSPAGISFCSAGVCWTEYNGTSNGRIESSTINPLSGNLVQGGLDTPWAITSLGGTEYWVDWVSPGAVTSSTGNNVGSQDLPVRVATSSNAVFWTNQGSGATTGSLMVADTNLMSPTPLATGLPLPTGLAVDTSTSTVYFGTTGAVSPGPGLWKIAYP